MYISALVVFILSFIYDNKWLKNSCSILLLMFITSQLASQAIKKQINKVEKWERDIKNSESNNDDIFTE